MSADKKRRTVYFGEPLIRFLESKPEGKSVSGSLNLAIDRYQGLLMGKRISLNEDEKELLVGYLKTVDVTPFVLSNLGELMVDFYFNSVKEQAAINLSMRLDLSFLERIATVEALGY